MLIAKNIKRAIGKTEILRGIDISVEPGRISIVIGPSGAGKTTLVKTLALLDHPTQGRISFEKHDYNFPLPEGKQIIPPWPDLTVVFQQHFLWPHLTLRENIQLPLRESSKIQHSVEELIDIFQMNEFIDRYPNRVSIGQRQRAALARAFALEPRYILLDEITAALDVEQTGAVIRHLLTLRQRGIGILVVTHLLEFAKQLVARNEGDQVYFLDEGKILDSGGANFFEGTSNERVRRFLSATDYWNEKI